MTEDEKEFSDTLTVPDDAKSSTNVLAAIRKAEDAFRDYHDTCKRIEDVYGGRAYGDWDDPEYDLFWSSMEILKPAIYSRTPKPAVAPMFSDRRRLLSTTSELLERVTYSAFERGNMNEVMLGVRDDLALNNRGQLWLSYESDKDGQRVCIEHLDRTDFVHQPARKWAEVGWVARRGWMTRKEMRNRFRDKSGDAYREASFAVRRDEKREGSDDGSKKAGVWEVWHKRQNKVYWVADGCPVLLDEGEPHLKLSDFFPCPRPAYGTIRPRTLVPIPDYSRYTKLLGQINKLTARIYLLLDKVKLKVLIPAAGDMGATIEQALTENDDSVIIPVPGAALMQGTASNFVQYLPLQEVAEAIQGLIQSRAQLFEDFYQLSGISDIMRGATDADETLGAQRLKGQYGSVRVRDKIDELQRIAKDASKIVAEIASEKFSSETLLDMSQMEIPSKKDIEKQVKEIEKTVKGELDKLGQQAKQMIDQAKQQSQQTGQPIDPQVAEQAQQQMQQQQQAILGKYAPMMQKAEETTPIEDVVKLLRDERARGFAFDIATDSTIMTDEAEEKASRAEFLGAFTNATTSLMQIATMGEEGASLAGGLMKFALAPFRVGRQLDALIDDFIEAAPKLAEQMQGKNKESESEKAMAQANLKLAEAEMGKAQAQAAKVQADAQGKMQDLQLRSSEAQAKLEAENQKLTLEMEKTRAQTAEVEARIEKIWAEIQKMNVDGSNQTRQQDREDMKTAADIEARQVDQAMSAQDRDRRAFESDRSAAMGERAEQRADRQQDFAERQSDREII